MRFSRWLSLMITALVLAAGAIVGTDMPKAEAYDGYHDRQARRFQRRANFHRSRAQINRIRYNNARWNRGRAWRQVGYHGGRWNQGGFYNSCGRGFDSR